MAVIPARGGSKGIPLKNIYPVDGKPLLVFALESALSSKLIDHVMVSTDSEEIARVASTYDGVEVLHRPPHLSQDFTPTLPVLLHALEQFPSDETPKVVVTLQPTSPLRTVLHIDEAIRLLTDDVDSCVSVCEVEHSPYKMFLLRDGLLTKLFDDAAYGVPRQLLPKVYRENGAVYVTWTTTLLQKNSIWGDKTTPYIMEQEDSIDIDTISDIRLAETILKNR